MPAWAWCLAGLIALAAGALLLLASPALLPASVWPRFIDERRDDQAYVAAKVMAGELADADVVVLGTSSAREALWPESDLQAALMHSGGEKQKIVNLASSSQSPLETLFLVSLQPTKPGQLYVVFVGFGALQLEQPFARLEEGGFLVSPEHLLAAYPSAALYPRHWTSGWSRWLMRWHALRQRLQRQIKFGLRSSVREAVYGLPAIRYQAYLYEGAQRASIPDRAVQLQQTSSALARNFEPNLTNLTRALDSLAVAVRQRGSRLVLVAPPDSAPELRSTHPAEYARFEATVGALAVRHGVGLFDWNGQVVWNRPICPNQLAAENRPTASLAADFIDATHVSAAGRDKWSAAFIAWLQSQRR